MSAKLSWWRVVIDRESGEVIDLAIVAQPDDASHSVFFVRAVSDKAATLAALKEYRARLTRERRARLEAEGKCPCGRERDREDRRYCSTCRQRHHESNQRRKAGKQDTERKLWAERNRERRAETAAPTRLAVQLELQAELDKTNSLVAVKIWLKNQINAAKPGKWGGDRYGAGSRPLRKVS